jgi:hypothetical protein
MALLRKSALREKVQKLSGFSAETNVRNFAANELLIERRAADRASISYDIFLSHSFEDAIYIKALRDELIETGFSVYVDWIEDPQLNRAAVTKATAALLRQRMSRCRSLLYATSTSSKKSVWMPWELGYMDSQTKSRVAIVPIVDDGQEYQDFRGQEYLGLYPYFDKTGAQFYIHESNKTYVGFGRWLSGTNPVAHS